MLALTFCSLLVILMYTSAKQIALQTATPIYKSSNPGYLLSGKTILLDDTGTISKLPEDGKSVWVEDIIDENTIKVSYFVVQAGEQILTFADVKLIGLYELNGCRKSMSKDFLASLLKHKYVYLAGGCFGGVGDTSKKLISKYVYIILEESGLENSEDFTPILSNMSEQKFGFNMLNVNYLLLAGGYAMATEVDFGASACSSQFSQQNFYKNIKTYIEVAQVSNKGFWGQCN